MKYATDWTETIAPGEDAQFEALAARVVAVQASRTPRLGPGRALHRRPIQSVEARFNVRPDLADVLPTELHVGPFAPGASYRAWVRFSNGSFDAPPKPEPDVRGFAFKIVGVPGKKLLTGADEPGTQDFLMIQTPKVPTADPTEFVALLEAGAGGGPLGIPFRLGAKIGYFRALQVMWGLVSEITKPFPSYATARFGSVTAFRLGPTAARWGLAPVEGAEPTPAGTKGLASDLAARLKNGLAWDFQVQLFQDATSTPVEDPTVIWDSPWITVGRLTLPPTDPESADGKRVAEWIETLSMDPWHAVEELRPLGAFNRSRKPTYWASSQNRPTVPEPTGNETI